MTYTRNPTWVDGTSAVTAALMENIEGGLSGVGAGAHVAPVSGRARSGFPPSSSWTFVGANTAYFYPVYYETTFGVASFGIHLRGSSAGSTVRLGLFANVPGGFAPGVVVAQTSLAGDIAGWKEALITPVTGLSAGWYWHASVSSASMDIHCMALTSQWLDGINMEQTIRQDAIGTRSNAATVAGAFTDNPTIWADALTAPTVGVKFA